MRNCRTFDCEKSIAAAVEQFKCMREYIRVEAQQQDVYTVERRVFMECMKLGLDMMGGYFEQKRAGDRGQLLEMPDGALLPRERLQRQAVRDRVRRADAEAVVLPRGQGRRLLPAG